PRPDDRFLSARREGRRRPREPVRCRRARRTQQCAYIPDGSARPAPHPRGQRGSPQPSRRTAPEKKLERRDRDQPELRHGRPCHGARAAAAVRYPPRFGDDDAGGGGEEEKIETETNKILGGDGGRAPLGAIISAQVNRVPVVDGHSMTVSVELASRPSPEEVVEAMRGFRGRPQELQLPSAPDPAIVLMSENNRPQPRLDVDLGNGMAVSVGRVRACPVLTHKFVALGHNTIRGAAGASVLNAELMHAQELL